MAGKITKSMVDKAQPETREYHVWDGELKGFGLRVRPGGAKTYVVHYRPGAGGREAKKVRYTIGQHGAPWTPDTAREKARDVLEAARKGVDSQAEKVEARRDLTVSDLIDLYMQRKAKPELKSWREYERTFTKYLPRRILDKRAADLTKGDVVRWRDDFTAQGRGASARLHLAHVKSLLSWAAEADYIPDNPARTIKMGGYEKRDRKLDAWEIAVVYVAADRLGFPFGPIVQGLILTAARRNEVAGLEWGELSGRDRSWTIPAHRSKNGRPHKLALPQRAWDLFNAQPRLMDAKGEPVAHVFTMTGSTAPSGFSRAHARLKTHVDAMLETLNPDGDPLAPWTWHDMRRTVATLMAQELKIAPHHVEAVLNHVTSRGGVAGVYNVADYTPDVAEALERWDAYLARRVRVVRWRLGKLEASA